MRNKTRLTTRRQAWKHNDEVLNMKSIFIENEKAASSADVLCSDCYGSVLSSRQKYCAGIQVMIADKICQNLVPNVAELIKRLVFNTHIKENMLYMAYLHNIF